MFAAEISAGAAQKSFFRKYGLRPVLHVSAVGVQHIMQHVHMIQHRTGTLGHAVQRILRNMHINTGLALDQLIQTAQQSAAAGQGNAAVDDIRTQLRRGAPASP